MITKFSKTQVKDLDESKGIVQVYANAFNNVDSDRDISLPGSFTKTLQEHFKRVKWFLNHNRNILLGVPIEGKEDATGLLLTAKFNLKKGIARDTFEDYKLYAENDRSLEHSIGVDAIKSEYDNESDYQKRIRRVSEWKLWEFSTLTSWGSNPNTPLVALKSDKDIADNIELLTKALQTGDYTDEKYKQIEKQLEALKATLSTLEESRKRSQAGEPPLVKIATPDELLGCYLKNIK